jgi:hypothetical protein
MNGTENPMTLCMVLYFQNSDDHDKKFHLHIIQKHMGIYKVALLYFKAQSQISTSGLIWIKALSLVLLK